MIYGGTPTSVLNTVWLTKLFKMPIYKYKCSHCGHEFEALQTIKEDPLTACTECKKEDVLQKCISLTSFRLLGKGWFKDGYKKD